MSIKKNDRDTNKLDDLFRDKLEDRSFEFQEEYWNDAESMLKEYEDAGKLTSKKRGFWWIWGGMILLLIIAASVFLHPFNKEQSASAPEAEENNVNPSSITHDERADAITKDEAGSKTVISDSLKNNFSQKPQAAQPEQDNLIGTEKNNRNTGNNKNIKDNKQQGGKIDTDNSEDMAGNSVSKNNNDQQKENLPESETEKITDAENGNPDLSEKENSTSANTTDDEDHSDNNAVTANIDTVAANKADTTTAMKISNDTMPDQEAGGDGPSDLDFMKKFGWHLGANYGFDYVTKSGSYEKMNAYSPSPVTRTESSALTFGGGISGGISLRNFTITTGFQLYKFGENIQYSYATSSIDTNYSILTDTSYFTVIDSVLIDSITYTYDYDTTYLIDGITVDSVPLYNFNDSNATDEEVNLLSYFEVPLLFGYRLDHKKWNFSFITGPSIGLYRFSSSHGLKNNGDLLNAPGNATITYTKTTFNWLCIPAVSYAINRNLNVQAQLWMRWNLNSAIVDPDYSLRYGSYGLHLGMEYRF